MKALSFMVIVFDKVLNIVLKYPKKDQVGSNSP